MRNPEAEWGYPGLGRGPARAAGLIFVACAVGTIAGAGAVFSLVAPPGSETFVGATHPLGSVVAHAAAHSPVKEPTLAPSQARSVRAPFVSQERLPSRVAVIDGSAHTPTSEGAGSAPVETAAAPPEHPSAPHEPVAKVAAPPAGAASPPSTEAPPAEKKASKKPAHFSRYAWRGRWGGFYEDRGWRSRQYW
jgi:hypothetical protein